MTPKGLRRKFLLQHAPDAAQMEIKAVYIKGTHEEAPFVVALNMRAAGDAVMEWIARQFGYSHEGSQPYSRTVFTLAGGEIDYGSETSFSAATRHHLGYISTV